ncbi:hypothetical protein Tco_0851158 [Tanacetum coccineum]
MMNEEDHGIRSLYELPWALSTNTELLKERGGVVSLKVKAKIYKKKRGKTKSIAKLKYGGVVPRKKSSITANDNILPDPDEALKLGKSISLTEADDQEEECHLHETHARLVTKKEADTADSKETK